MPGQAAEPVVEKHLSSPGLREKSCFEDYRTIDDSFRQLHEVLWRLSTRFAEVVHVVWCIPIVSMVVLFWLTRFMVRIL